MMLNLLWSSSVSCCSHHACANFGLLYDHKEAPKAKSLALTSQALKVCPKEPCWGLVNLIVVLVL